MKFVARVLAADGSPLAEGTAELVDAAGPTATGKIKQGALSLTAEPGPAWGLSIDGKPVIAVVVKADAKRVDLGDIALVSEGVAWPAFHSADGLVWGAPPGALAAQPSRTAEPAAQPARATASAAATTDLPPRTTMTFGSLLGSTAQQLTSAAVARTGLSLAGATVTVKGIPTATDDAIGLEFPTAEIAATGVGLTELSFNLRSVPPAATAPPKPKGISVPDLGAYTRDLATRKLAGLGLIPEITGEAVTDPAKIGRVTRQIPRPTTLAQPGSIVRLFIGK
jgi:hypothetical protein